jgi:lipopolysaccharide export LptBFGC system permease protein LptF
MALMAAFFTINNVRSKNNILLFVLGILMGLIFYIALVIFGALGASGIVSIFITSWMIPVILIAISMLLIFRKEVIN